MKPMPFVCVVMPNWNGKDDTLECLDSLRKLNYPKGRMEIIVVDNGSKDGSPECIKEIFSAMKQDGYSSLKLIELPENMGAPAAINKGIKNAQPDYDYIFKIDNDIVMDRECLISLIKVMETDLKIGIAGGKVYQYGSEYLIQSAGADINLWLGTTPPRGDGEVDHHQYDKIDEVDYVCGAGMMVKSLVIREIGLLDQAYFVYYDETDWSLRANRAGFKVVFVPDAIMWHKRSATTLKISGFVLYHMNRSRTILERKHANFLQYCCFNLYTCCYEFPIWILKNFAGSLSHVKYFFRGIWDGHWAKIIPPEDIS
jgi:GT2 family glycosyltransferase